MSVTKEVRLGPVQVFEPEPGRRYSLDAAAHLVGIRRRRLLLYVRAGLVQPLDSPAEGELAFDEEAIRNARRAEGLRSEQGMNMTALSMIFDLLREVEGLRRELQFLRGD